VPARQPWQRPVHRHWRLRRATALAHSRRLLLPIIDENEGAAGDGGLAVTGHAKRALDIGGALGSRQPNLLCGRLDPLERAGGDRYAGLALYIAAASMAD
jgi:hypothetical protein